MNLVAILSLGGCAMAILAAGLAWDDMRQRVTIDEKSREIEALKVSASAREAGAAVAAEYDKRFGKVSDALSREIRAIPHDDSCRNDPRAPVLYDGFRRMRDEQDGLRGTGP